MCNIIVMCVNIVMSDNIVWIIKEHNIVIFDSIVMCDNSVKGNKRAKYRDL